MSEYIVACWSCTGEYDAVSAVWCNCDSRNPTKLCPYCLRCFCSASPEFADNFWKNAPNELLEEKYSLNSTKAQLGHILVAGGLITVAQLVRAAALSKATGKKLGEALVSLGLVTAEQLEQALAMQKPAGGSAAVKAQAARASAGSSAAVAGPTGLPGGRVEAGESVQSPSPLSSSSPDLVKDTLNNLMLAALKRHASALYIEPSEEEVVVRVRIDGVLFKLKTLPAAWQPQIMERVKQWARLQASETRMPQTGRMSLRVGERTFDMIVQTLPSAQGEGAGLRIINRELLKQNLSALGFEERDYTNFIRVVDGTHGLVVLNGPLFNAVTETAYSVLNHLVLKNRKVVSLESPITSALTGVNQLEIQESRGFDFAQALKTILNLSPDVIFLGDIPDGETLKLASRMASAIQVFAALDCSNAFQVFERLKMLSGNAAHPLAALQLVVSQRVIRRNCPHCIERKANTPSLASEMGLSGDEIHLVPEVARGKGCSNCNDLGYSGRKILFETLVVDDEVRNVLTSGGGQEDFEHAAAAQDFRSLRMLHLREVAKLATSPEEFIRCAYPRPLLRRIYRVK
ncbi:MAG: ATPase, T2SS/T4P/T4SS family [Acidobacteriota bacterium]